MARAQREPELAVLGVAQMGAHIGLQDRGIDRLQQALLRRLPEIAGVDRNQYVGLGRLALGGQACQQRTGLVGDEAYRDAGFLGIAQQQWLDQVFGTGRVDYQLRVLGLAASGHEQQGGETATQAAENSHEADPHPAVRDGRDGLSRPGPGGAGFGIDAALWPVGTPASMPRPLSRWESFSF